MMGICVFFSFQWATKKESKEVSICGEYRTQNQFCVYVRACVRACACVCACLSVCVRGGQCGHTGEEIIYFLLVCSPARRFMPEASHICWFHSANRMKCLFVKEKNDIVLNGVAWRWLETTLNQEELVAWQATIWEWLQSGLPTLLTVCTLI